jgi:hypothetical protein
MSECHTVHPLKQPHALPQIHEVYATTNSEKRDRGNISMAAPSSVASSIRKGGKFDMKTTNQENGKEPFVLASARLGVGSWSILVVLFLLLAGTLVLVYEGWTLATGTDVPASGYVAMALGVIVSLGVGFGLMALIFYSSRKGYDEPPVLISFDGDGNESDAVSESKK